jgi:hypothetical protein
MEFERGEMVEWSIEDRNKLTLSRREQLFDHEKKKLQTDL